MPHHRLIAEKIAKGESRGHFLATALRDRGHSLMEIMEALVKAGYHVIHHPLPDQPVADQIEVSVKPVTPDEPTHTERVYVPKK